MTDDLELTDEQADALLTDRNVAITAGAGTGKTTTLTERYVELLESDPETGPEDIVTITFTRKAAAELRTRVREEAYERLEAADEDGETSEYERWRDVLDELDDGYIHTIHAFCARILREHGVEAPVSLGFDVLDETASAELQREVVADYLDAESDDADVALLARLWDRGRLADVLVGLLDSRPESAEWADHWRDASVEEYVTLLREEVSEFGPETALEVLDSEAAREALDAIARLDEADLAVEESVAGMEVLRELAGAIEGLPENPEADPEACQDAVLRLYSALETQSGGLYSSASYHVVGKKAEWSAEEDAYGDLKRAIDSLIDALEAREEAIRTAPGDLERNSAHYVLALARVFDGVLAAYEEAKERRNALDFPDLVETTREFLADPERRADLREEFDAVMVDEFQDTDPRQWDLVRKLAGVADDADHVFLVGDEKQSIYGFRGADVTTFGTARRELGETNARLGLDFVPGGDSSERNPDRPTDLELSGNFRTLETPLSFVNALFGDLFRPEGDERAPYEARPQSLSVEREDRPEGQPEREGSVEYLCVPETGTASDLLGADHPVAEAVSDHPAEAEARALAARLTHLFADPPTIHDSEEDTCREATPEDVAVLLRRRTHLDRYQRALDEQGIPYTVVGGVGFYDRPEVRALVNLLRVLADPSDDVALYGVLRSALFGFEDDRLAELAVSTDSVWNALESTDDPQLGEAFDLLSAWRTLAGCESPGDEGVLPWGRVLTRVVDDTGYLASVGASDRGRQAVANVEKFRDRVRDWSEAGARTAASLLHRIDRRAELDAREGEAEIPDSAEGVRLTTIHGAKGLEFPVVAVPDLGSKLNYGRSIDEYGHVELADEADGVPPVLAVAGPSPDDAHATETNAAHDYAESLSLPRERAEAKRLLYVACTRVRDHLLLCGTHEVEPGEGSREAGGGRASEGDEGDAEIDLRFGETEDFDAAERWRDWLQPRLLDREEVAGDLFETGAATATLGGASYEVRLPPEPTAFEAREEATGDAPRIEIPAPDHPEGERRVSATDVVDAVSEWDGGEGEGGEDGETGYASAENGNVEAGRGGADGTESVVGTKSDDGDALPAAVFGTVVHRLAELRPSDEEVESYARRIAGMAGHEVADDDLGRVRRHARDAIEYVESLEADREVGATYDELSVTARLGDVRVVGDVDHLTVTPEAYLVTDYKTNRVAGESNHSGRSLADLREHYRPQMLCYALALHQHDPSRAVRTALRFTDAGETETFRWEPDEMDAVRAELGEMLAELDSE